jgi:hypothetical protein
MMGFPMDGAPVGAGSTYSIAIDNFTTLKMAELKLDACKVRMQISSVSWHIFKKMAKSKKFSKLFDKDII